ncbi:drug/metabolite transporter (DMT)-like permease [Crossiella equi]|uniref:Drug/metabolite transporter (DMT)-like permease n=1 Tax=Crossiella equi TaxID=130796 RepID=A0ABS5APC5_9PSEU|nr:EamA family transporter [Crossiella equi]MBP2478414.1 drug/metabolite transporter (DMT)-like permease [Crossiella equi]
MIALGLLVVAALCHAGWNLLIKSAPGQGPEFVWLYSVIALPGALGLLGWSLAEGTALPSLWPGLVSMLLHTGYALVLQSAYRVGEFSVVYPVSRGTPPALVTLATIPWTGWPRPLAWCGLALVLGGVLAVEWVDRRPGAARGVWLGLGVAACGCAYTLWDAYAITALGVHVLPYLAVGNLGQVLLLTVFVRARGTALRPVLAHWRRALPVALLIPAGYGLVLVALALEPVAAVATGRTLNVVLGVLLGALVLRERITPSRLAGLAAVVAGVLLVSA